MFPKAATPPPPAAETGASQPDPPPQGAAPSAPSGGSESPNLAEKAGESAGKSDTPEARSFERAWGLYGRKGNKKTSLRLWASLPRAHKELALQRIPPYVAATPDAQFRKNFETYLRQEAWSDEIVKRKKTDYEQRTTFSGNWEASTI
jgi:hypothetical protein